MITGTSLPSPSPMMPSRRLRARAAYVPAAAQQLLERWDHVASHYEVVEERGYS